ncbi:immunoglobulin domain-containing protein [Pseudoflavonifractor phocaeensis]|uniref:immunoglobulin domain-containing protein n=1 Tax=Pseudoflavonifractor phocaeensis TaxID=1870988 RepID=UPI00195AAB74|nr:immunoglobulin domain-containing protein [Pseudoflavonifractor phocaeensis]MBM6925035.1 immunoglobulin domain-containing protein [Pseudoflavonifractor phocaeensis]
MKKRFFAVALCLCLLVGLVPGMNFTVFAANDSDYVIGDIVAFAGYTWRIAGTETQGATAPSGYYTLFADKNDFGSIAFRAGVDATQPGDNQYYDSDLQQKMEEIAGTFSEKDKANIYTRTLRSAEGEVTGPDVYNQYLWAPPQGELSFFRNIWTSEYAQFWSCTGDNGTGGTYDVWFEYTGQTGDPFLSTPVAPTSVLQVRPALYVKASALSDYVLGLDTISNAYVGGDLEYSRGTDGGLYISDSQKADVRVGDSKFTQSGEFLSFRLYGDGTTTGENQVLACFLTDQNGTVKYYGKLVDCSGSLPAETNFTIPMAGVANGTYTLSIFSHNTQTNEISQPSPTMTVSVSNRVGTVSNYQGGNFFDTPLIVEQYPPEFTKHPQTQIVGEGESVTFSAEAEDLNGGTITYSWYAQDKSSDPDGTWYQISRISGGDVGLVVAYSAPNLTISNVSRSWSESNLVLDAGFQPRDARFRCVATGLYNLSNSSEAAELLVVDFDGQEVELRNNGTSIQWRYEGEADSAWRDLVALDAITGGDGREVALQIDNGYIQWRYTTGGDTAWKNLISLSDLKGDPGEDGQEVELQNNGTSIQWRHEGEAEWKDLVDLSAITGSDGTDGKQVELRVEGGYIQWKYDADADWQNLIALSALQGIKGEQGDKGDKGDPGEDGKTPYIGDNGNWWIDGVDTGIPATGSSGSDGSDGSNGKDGQDGKDGKDGKDGEDGKDGLTPYIGSNGNWWIGTTDTGVKAAGADGKDGANGKDGKDGVGIADITLNGNGELVVTLTDGTVKNLGKISVTGSGGSDGEDGATGADGSDGKDGVGIADIRINENGELVVALTDGTEKNLGKVTGADGVGISGVSINENGELIVTLTDGTELNAGAVPTTAAETSELKTIVYVSMGTAGVSLAGMLGLLAFLLTKRKMLIGK